MPLYTYTVKDKFGKTITGKMNMDGVASVAKKLKEMEYIIVAISPAGQGVFSVDIAERFARIKLIDKVTLYIKLASMLKAGVPLASSLESVKEQIDNKRLQKVVDDIHRNILAGNSLSHSLALYPKIFPELLINVVQSGEASGKLVEVLDRYAVFTENQAVLRQKIVSALTYPCILIVAGIGLMFIFLTFLLPRFVDMFEKANIALPLPTQVLMGTGDFFGKNKVLILVGLIVLIISLKIFTRLRLGKRIADLLKLKSPYIGKLVRKLSIARFSRTLATLYTSGVPIIMSLEICERSTGNIVFAGAIHRIKEGVTKGESFSAIMDRNSIFPRDMTQLVAIGERSGNLSDMLYKVSEFYERDVDYAVKNISSLIEPIILLMVGAIIGFLAYSIIMPIFNMMQAM